jgi:hypothetical protein
MVSGFGAGGGMREVADSVATAPLGATLESSGPELALDAFDPPMAVDEIEGSLLAVLASDARKPSLVRASLPAVAARPPSTHASALDPLSGDVDADELALYSGPTEAAVGVIEGKLQRGQTLSAALDVHGVRPSTINAISSELFPLFDFHKAQPGQAYRLVLDAGGQLLEFDYQINAHELCGGLRLGVRLQPQRAAGRRVPGALRAAVSRDARWSPALRPAGTDPRGALPQRRAGDRGHPLRAQ